MNKILVTPRSLTKDGDPALDLLKNTGYDVIFCTPGKQPDEAELLTLVPGCVGYLAGVERISARVLEAANELRVISRNGTGIDNIDLNAAKRLNIQVCRAEGANARGVAELTLGLILALVRSIPFSDAHLKKKQWVRRKGTEVDNLTLGLVGCGEVGKRTALLAVGVGMRVIAYDPYPNSTFSPSNFSYTNLENLLRQTDIISLHCPAPATGRPLIDRSTISKMKTGVYLINTARASLIDHDAVHEGLESGQISGVALDVFDQEPPSNYMLINDSRVIATPHIGGYTAESVTRATAQAVGNLIKMLK